MILAPCPFCGARKEVKDASHTITRQTFWVECQRCLATGPEHPSRDEAEEAWNKRDD